MGSDEEAFAAAGIRGDGDKEMCDAHDADDDQDSAMEDEAFSDTVEQLHVPFRLMDLAAELRNEVYDQALLEKETPITLRQSSKKDNIAQAGPVGSDMDGIQTIAPMPVPIPVHMPTPLLTPAPVPAPAMNLTGNAPNTTGVMPPLAAAMHGLTTIGDLDRLSSLPFVALHATIRNKANVNMLLADKQINAEYESRADRAMELVLTDHQDFTFQAFHIPSFVAKIQILEVNLILFCHACFRATHTTDISCHGVLELVRHCKWIDDLRQQMPKLKKLSIFAHICYDSFKVGGKTRPPCEKLVTKRMKALQGPGVIHHIRVYCAEFDQHSGRSLDGPKELVYEWKDGEVIKVKKGPEPKPEDVALPMSPTLGPVDE
ncbi:uncharacterized protein LTR77_003567 [Saxophila tyrrhenica]|uniref:Uncharacterized protein n=1 Tax=Saxophila tyrrhenica TaxID=1690608 RepID=A0AAV9PE13_9PEZI|nr:hypothetical protein LTR77_003567 [Saxophila tyrrhenica]